MIVCVCANINEKTLKSACERGNASLKDLQKLLKVGTGCGRCLETVAHELNTHSSCASQTNSIPAHAAISA